MHLARSNLQLNHKIASSLWSRYALRKVRSGLLDQQAHNDIMNIMKKIRLILAIIILSISISLLIWAYFPNQTETRIQNISPQEMQLPTPSSLHYEFVI